MGQGGRITPEGFERKFQASPDPWATLTSLAERRKRDALLSACGGARFGGGRFRHGLELACGIGNNTRALARVCRRLDALDAAPTALRRARETCRDAPNVSFSLARLPDGLPRGPFDLVVVAEIAYYLPRPALPRIADRLARRVAKGARIVLLHHVIPFDDAAARPDAAHHALAAMLSARVGRRRRAVRDGRWRIDVIDL